VRHPACRATVKKRNPLMVVELQEIQVLSRKLMWSQQLKASQSSKSSTPAARSRLPAWPGSLF
jgi:hypothetical protein